jgi:sialate O-acetylesterase
MSIKVLFVALMLASFPSASCAAVEPAALFSDNAVLQQGVPVPVWGTAADGERVTVEFAGQKVSTTARGGKWAVRLRPLVAGGPFAMIVAGENRVQINNVLVGEVWICSGQSNMAFTLSKASNAAEAIAASADPQLRLLTVPRAHGDTPLDDIDARWQVCGPETAPEFSAVGYFFGRDLRRALGVPVGLINASYGGTMAQGWMRKEVVEADPDLTAAFKTNPANAPPRPSQPGRLYNSMIHPLIPYAIKGVIWYQGEANRTDAYRYRKVFPALIRNWRDDWKQGQFPFLFVQIAPFGPRPDKPEQQNLPELRESQLLTSETVPNTAMVVITDYGHPTIHPTCKEPVGDRLALAARAIAYNQDVAYRGPALVDVRFKAGRAVLSFTDTCGGLVAKGGDLTGFIIAGQDRKFYPARASIVGAKVVVSSPDVPSPAAVRYGWSAYPEVNLFNKAGLPASPFRTDSFPLTTQPK